MASDPLAELPDRRDTGHAPERILEVRGIGAAARRVALERATDRRHEAGGKRILRQLWHRLPPDALDDVRVAVRDEQLAACKRLPEHDGETEHVSAGVHCAVIELLGRLVAEARI